MSMTSKEKISLLRREMAKEQMDFYMVTTEDAFMAVSGVTHSYWRGLCWLTGFTGSAGFAIVTMDKVGFWTDSRYHLQAADQIELDQLEIFNTTETGCDQYLSWIREQAEASGKEKLVFGLDGRTISTEKGMTLESYFHSFRFGEMEIQPEKDLLDRIWTDRPQIEYQEIWEYDLKYTGRSRQEKAEDVRREMKERGADYYIPGGLEGVPWLTNLRGHESSGAPLFSSHMLVTPEELWLFCKREKLSAELQEKLEKDGYRLFDIDCFSEKLTELPEGARVYMDLSRTNYLMSFCVPESCEIVEGWDIINDLKAVKNPVEIENLRRANCLESVALFRLFRYLREHMKDGAFTEYDAHLLLEKYRKRNEEYIADGSKYILCAGYMKNGAWPHYAPTPEIYDVIEPRGLIVVDALSHYLCGSIDMCRTIYLGPCPEYEEQMRKDYAVVLKAFIAICSQVIRKGATGVFLDSVVRSVMWNHHLQYGHGTGHGLGYANCLHEGPQSISELSYKKDWASSALPIQPGNEFAIEPGLYREGKYGMRIEDNLVVVEDEKNEFGEFYRLENLFYHPLERDLIDPDALSDEELAWVNRYHAETYRRLSPYLEEEERGYLKEQTAPIAKRI